jgi:hypothetical protein
LEDVTPNDLNENLKKAMDELVTDDRKADPLRWVTRIQWAGFIIAILGFGFAFLSSHGRPALVNISQVVGFAGIGVYFVCRLITIFIKRKYS